MLELIFVHLRSNLLDQQIPVVLKVAWEILDGAILYNQHLQNSGKFSGFQWSAKTITSWRDSPPCCKPKPVEIAER